MSTGLSRRQFLASVAALSGGIVLAACAPKAQPTAVPKAAEVPKAAAKEIELRYASWWGAYNTMALPDSIKELKDLYPNVTVKLEELADATMPYRTCYVAGTCADITYHNNEFSKYYDEGVILELTDYYERDGIDFYEDFFHGLALCLWKGKLYGVPHMFETCVLFYNRDMIEERWGKDLWEAFPDGNWDIEDMVEVSKACARDTSGDGAIDEFGLYCFHRHYYYGMETQSWTRGGGIFDIDNVKYNFTGEHQRASAHFFLDNIRGPDASFIGEEDYAEINKASAVTFPFMAQKTAMRIRMCTDAGRIINSVGPGDGSEGFRWDIFHLPNVGGNQAVTRAGGHPTNISKSTEYPDEAWNVCRELGTSLGQKYIARTKMSTPCYRKDPDLMKEYIVGVPEHDVTMVDVVTKKGGYGDHLRFHNEGECRAIFTKAFDLLYNMPYNEAKAQMDDVLAKVEEEMNAVVDYGGGDKPYAGLPFPFQPEELKG